MRLFVALMVGASVIAACGGDEPKSPREACIDAEETVNEAALACDPQFGGRIDLSCQNFGTGSGCDAIDAYFDCLAETSCVNGMLVFQSNCQLGACN
jgi:hypothetical protein